MGDAFRKAQGDCQKTPSASLEKVVFAIIDQAKKGRDVTKREQPVQIRVLMTT